MGVTLSIKAVPESVAAQLRARARRNHRSLQGELLAIVEAAAEDRATPDAHGSPVAGNTLGKERGRPASRKGTTPIEVIASRLRELTPVPRSDFPLSVDIVRQLRDSR